MNKIKIKKKNTPPITIPQANNTGMFSTQSTLPRSLEEGQKEFQNLRN
jgi:hypothetical protein